MSRSAFCWFFEDLQRESGIQLGVVDASASELSVLVVLDKMVIGVPGEGEGIESERVDRRQPQEAQSRIGGLEVRQIEIDQVVAEQELCPIGKVVQLGQRRSQAAPIHRGLQGLASVRSYSRKRTDAVVPGADFKV